MIRQAGETTRGRRLYRLVRATVRQARRCEIGTLAAATAYYALVSVVPLAVVTITVASALAGDRLAAALLDATGSLLTASGEQVVQGALAGSGGGTTLLGLLVLSWSGLRLFRGVDAAFSRVYGTSDGESLVGSVLDAAVVFVVSSIALAASIGVGAFLRQAPGFASAIVGQLTVVVTLVGVFLPVFYRFPDTDVTVRGVLPGATLAAVGWGVLNVAFVAYAATASATAAGVLGGVLLLVTWFYFAAVVVLLGACLNVVWGRRLERAD